MRQGTEPTGVASRRLAATRFLAMTIGTAVVGAAVATASAYVGGMILGGRLGDFGSLGVILLVMMVGYVLGVIAGIVITHRLIGYRGSVWLGVVGSVLGIGIMLGLVAEPLNVNLGLEGLFAGMLAAPALLGAIGFHIRRWREGAKEARNRTGEYGGDGRI